MTDERPNLRRIRSTAQAIGTDAVNLAARPDFDLIAHTDPAGLLRANTMVIAALAASIVELAQFVDEMR